MSAVEAKEPGFFTKGVKEKTSDSEWVRYALSNRIPLCAAGHCALPAPTRLAAFIVYEESFIVLSLTSLMIPFIGDLI